MKNKGNKKYFRKLFIVLALILLPIGAFTLGYFFKNNSVGNQVANTLTVDGSIEGSITENLVSGEKSMVPGDEVSATININPKSTAKSLLRVKLEPYWMNGDAKSGLSTDNLEIIFEGEVEESLSDGSWYKNGNYYYYINQVDESTGVLELVKGIKFLAKSPNIGDINQYQGKGIGVSVTMDMVQCSDRAYQSRWSDDNIPEGLKDKLNSLCESSKIIN